MARMVSFRDLIKKFMSGIPDLVIWESLVLLNCSQCDMVFHSFRYTRQVLDETMRASVLAPWGARIHEFDLQVGEFVIPKEVII